MIYQPKPQRGGRSIPVNTNNPPQDPPPPPSIVEPIKISDKTVEFSVSSVGPEPQTPEPVKVKPIKVIKPKVTPKVTPKVIPPKKVAAVSVKLTILQKISKFFKKIFRRI